jgi:ribosomal protein L40E
MPICTRCGSRNVEGARFCGNCGALVLVHQKVRRRAAGISLTVTAFLIVLLLVGVFLRRDYSSWSKGGASTFDYSQFARNFGIATSSEATPDDGFNPDSTESFTPYLLSKNPYRWKGHSGILDTQYTTEIWPNGNIMLLPGYGGTGIHFAKMLDEHTATYDVMTVVVAGSGGSSYIPDGQIAVIVPNNTPPDPQKPWKVLVEGPATGTNAFGADLTVTTVKFEGYYEPPPPPPVPAPVPAPTTTPAAPAQSNATQPQAEPESAPKPALSFQSSPQSTDVSPAPVASRQETSGSPSASQIADVTPGQTPDQVVAILGPPTSITTGPTPAYNYPHLVIIFARGKVWKIHQFPSQ